MGWIFLIGAIVLFLLAFGLEYLFYSTTKKESQKQSVTKTHAPIKRTVTSLVITVVLCVTFVNGAVAFILSNQTLEIAFWLGYTFGGLFCISIPFMLFLICTHDYEIIAADSIIVNRLFGRKAIKYSDISHFRYSLNQLTVYDKNDFVLFYVGDVRIGLNSLIQALEKHGVQQKFVVATQKITKDLLSQYNRKIQFINSQSEKRHTIFIEHNAHID